MRDNITCNLFRKNYQNYFFQVFISYKVPSLSQSRCITYFRLSLSIISSIFFVIFVVTGRIARSQFTGKIKNEFLIKHLFRLCSECLVRYKTQIAGKQLNLTQVVIIFFYFFNFYLIYVKKIYINEIGVLMSNEKQRQQYYMKFFFQKLVMTL